MKSNQKKRWGLRLKIAIAVFAIFFLFKSGWLTANTFQRLFKTANIPFLLLSCLFFFTAQILASWRLLKLLRSIHYPIRFSHAFRLTMIGNFFNSVIPGSFGGDAIKGFYLFKGEEENKGQSAGIIVADRILGLFSLLLIAIFSLAFLLWKYRALYAAYHRQLYLGLIAACFLFGLGWAFIFFGKNPRLRKILKHYSARFFRSGPFYQLIVGLGAIPKHRQIMISAFFLSVAIQIFSLAGFLMTSNIIPSHSPDIITKMAVSSIVMLIGVIPITPGNIGWTELMAAFGWSAVGSSAGAEAFLFWRIVTVSCSLMGGLFYFKYRSKY